MAFSIVTLSRTLSIMTLSILTINNVMTLSSIMTLSMTLSITTLYIMALSIMTFGIKSLSLTVKKCAT